MMMILLSYITQYKVLLQKDFFNDSYVREPLLHCHLYENNYKAAWELDELNKKALRSVQDN